MKKIEHVMSDLEMDLVVENDRKFRHQHPQTTEETHAAFRQLLDLMEEKGILGPAPSTIN